MPIYEYHCRACSRRFERLVSRADATVPECPSCRSTDVKRLLSAFSVVGSHAGPAPGPCGSPDCACRSN